MTAEAALPPSLVPDGITDVYPHALSFLPLADIARLSLVSKEWRDASNRALPNDVKLFFTRRTKLLSFVEKKLKQKRKTNAPATKNSDDAIEKTISEMSIKAMKTELESSGIVTAGMEKTELVSALKRHMQQPADKDENYTNTAIIDANRRQFGVVCKQLTRLFLNAAQNPRLRMKPNAPAMPDEEKDYYSRTFFAIAILYEELGWLIDDTMHRIEWDRSTGDRFINHEILNMAKYSLLTHVESFFPCLNQYGVALLLKEAKKDVYVSKISPFSLFSDTTGEGSDALEALLGLMRRRAPKEEQREARAFFFVLHKEFMTYLLELKADSAKKSDEKDDHGQTMADKVGGIIGLAAYLLHEFEEYANNPNLETFDASPTSPDDESDEAALHFVSITKASMDLKLLTTFTLIKGKHHDKIISFTRNLDMVFNFSFPFLSNYSKKATHDVIFEDTAKDMEGKKVFKMSTCRTDENGKLIRRSCSTKE